jgi:hypothetical protein
MEEVGPKVIDVGAEVKRGERESSICGKVIDILLDLKECRET